MMPTIQFRTDDQTKTASTALFNQLGITMSEAINLFLRQSIMRGGIPFTLNVPKEQTGGETPGIPAEAKGRGSPLDDEAIIDALRRYKAISGKAGFDMAKAEPFLQALRTLDPEAEPCGEASSASKITLYEDAVKVRMPYKGREFVIDYNFEEPDSVFILSRKDGKLAVRDCGLDRISQTLESF
jgi:addiction module RelB/DinJ family antitoxin